MKPESSEGPRLVRIAHIENDFPEKFGLPRQSLRVPELRSLVVFEKPYSSEEALRGIEGFSHVWLIWGFSLTGQTKSSLTVRPPRLGGNKRMGVFATRSPNRPNPIGLSCVKLLCVRKENGLFALEVAGADLANGTPIYDVKPYLRASDCVPDAKDGFAEEFEDYALQVDCPEKLLLRLPEEKRAALLGILREDPRPAYHSDERSYGLSFAGFEVSFFVDRSGVLHVTEIGKPQSTAD